MNMVIHMEERLFLIFVLILYQLWFKASLSVNAHFKEMPPT